MVNGSWDGSPLVTNYPPATRGKVVLWGLLGSYPFGGMTWQVLHHLVALRRLGFDVWYVEDSDGYLFDPETYLPTWDEYSGNLAYLQRRLDEVGLNDRWVFRAPGAPDRYFGLDRSGVRKLYREADAVLNICGAQELRPDHGVIRCLVYLETDPGPTQIAVANGDDQVIRQLDSYDHLFTYAQNLGRPDCVVPVERYRWHPTVPPVCVDWWSAGPPSDGGALTTILNWKHSVNDVEWKGKTYRWTKDIKFRSFADLPARSARPLELCVGAISDEDAALMRSHGWRVVSSETVADPARYRDYVCSSLGEFTMAKEQYVDLRTGWFSDRSVCYLAAARPVVTEDTGFSNAIPTGEGLFAFSTQDEAVAAIEEVSRDYSRHSQAAREIAREYFDAERVLGRVLSQIGLL